MNTAPSARVSPVRLARAGLLAGTLAAGANALVYTAARAAGVSLVFPLQPGAAPGRLPLAMVVSISAAGALAGTVVLALLRRFFTRGAALFPIVGGVVLVLSLGLPLSLTVADGATKSTLVLMHVVAGTSIIAVLSGTVGRRTR